MRRALAVLLLALWPLAAGAVQPDEILADPALEARAREISKELRCLVCQNQSIDDSNAGLARDLRLLVRERLVAGDSDEEVLSFVVARYGDFVLLRPPVRADTLLLWLAPAGILVLGGVGVAVAARRKARAGAVAPPLSAEESERLKRLMEGEA